MRLELVDVGARRGASEVLRGVNLALESLECVAVVGPSGAGKSTLLSAVAGLCPCTGEVRLDGRTANGLAPRARGLGVVFQELALWPHLDVQAHLEFVLAAAAVPRVERRERIRAELEELELTPLAARRPHQPSGGEQQRLALARARVARPGGLLLDEPLGALDGGLRARLLERLRAAHGRAPATTLLVTHAFDEACALATRVAVLVEGAVEQLDTPEALFRRPLTRRVAELTGPCAFLRGRRRDGLVELPLGERPAGFAPGAMGEVGVLLRPGMLRAAPGPGARVVASRFEAGAWCLEVELAGQHCPAQAEQPLAPGTEVALALQGELWAVPWPRTSP